MTAVSVYLKLEDDNTDWFDGKVKFPVLPPVGSLLHVIDRNANLREWRVKDVIVNGRPLSSESPYKPELWITLLCTGF